MQRIAYLDNLRALVVILVVLLHTILPYSLIEPDLHYQWSNHTDAWATCFVYCAHSLTMPLFFWLAGFFAHYILKKHHVAYFINERLVRLAIPLLCGLLLFLPFHFVVFAQYLWQALLHTTQYDMRHILIAATAHNVIYRIFFDLEYLWFIYYLLLYSFFALLLQRFNFTSLTNLLNTRYKTVILTLILTSFIALGSMPYIAISPYLIPVPQTFLSYGLFFWIGWVIFAKQEIITETTAPVWFYLLPGTLSLGLALYLTLAHNLNLHTLSLGKTLITSAIFSFALIHLSFGIVLLFYRHINYPIALCRYLSEISYWIYLIRLPVLACCQYFLLYGSWPLLLQIFVAFIAAMFLCIVSYELLVKPTFIKKYLKGQHQLKFLRKHVEVL